MEEKEKKEVTLQQPWGRGSSEKKSKKTKSTDKISEEAIKEGQSVPGDSTGTKSGALGIPKGTPVYSGQGRGLKGQPIPGTKGFGTALYEKGSGATIFASLNNQERIDLLGQLSQIQGLYSDKTRPTQEYLLSAAVSRNVAPRPEDLEALEKVMTFANLNGGIGYDTAITTLVGNPNIAIGYFGATTGPKKIRQTPADALALEFEQSIMDYLDTKVSKAEKNAYAKKVNQLEAKRGGALTELERRQVLTESIQDKARQVFKDVEPDSDMMRQGALGETYNTLLNTYRDFGVPVSDNKIIYRQAIQSLRSKQALDNIINKIRLSAEVSMPAIKTYLQQGLTAREALGSYVNIYSKLYDVSPDMVDLTKLAPVVSGDKIMSTQDWLKYLYAQPEIKDSPYFKQQQFNDAQALVRNFIG